MSSNRSVYIYNPMPKIKFCPILQGMFLKNQSTHYLYDRINNE